jgi:anti-anti-sigma factor
MKQLPRLVKGLSSARFEADESQGPLRRLAGFTVVCCGRTCVVRVIGEVDISNSPALENILATLFRAHRGVVVASFVQCTFADSSCLSVLIRQCKAQPARLVIIAPPANPLRRVLDRTSLAAALPVFDTLRRAELAVTADAGIPRDLLAKWKSERRRSRLNEVVSATRGSPRSKPAPERKVSPLHVVCSGEEYAP